MAKFVLSTVLFIAVVAEPTFGASPAKRYDAAVVLLLQAQLDVAAANPATVDELNASDTIDFALEAAVKAADDALSGKDNRINAKTAAQTAYIGVLMCHDLYLLYADSDPDLAQHWLDAANNAYAAAVLLDAKTGSFPQ